MNCRKVNKIIDKYIDGELNNNNSKEFEKHILSCKECKNTYNSYILLKKELKLLSDTPLPSGFESALRLKLTRESQSVKAFNFRPVFNTAAALAVAFALAFGINSYFGEDTTGDDLSNVTFQGQEIQPMAVAESDGLSLDYMRKVVIFGEYEVMLSDKPEIVEKISAVAEINDNKIICDAEAYDKIYEILFDNEVSIEFLGNRENNNLIIIK